MLRKVYEVFMKEYKKETEYREFTNTMVNYFKLKNISESVEDKVKKLSDENFESNFSIKIGAH